MKPFDLVLIRAGCLRCGLTVRVVSAFGLAILNTRLDALDVTVLVGPVHIGLWLNRDRQS